MRKRKETIAKEAPVRQPFLNQIVGLVRFSYPSRDGYRISQNELPALEAILYDPDRLERRFQLFEQLTLPSLVAQTDGDFQTLFVTGENMPADYLQRLRRGVGALPGAMVLQLPPMIHYRAMQRAFRMARKPECSHLTGFRLDDDDAVDCRYVERLRRVSQTIGAAAAEGAIHCVGFNRGLFLRRKEGGNRIYEVVEKLPIGIGLAMIAPAGREENIFRRNHRLLPQFFNTYTEADTPSFIRTIHPDNDSRPSASGQVIRLSEQKLTDIVERHFPFSVSTLRTL